MSENKKFTTIIVLLATLFIFLSVLSLITESFVFVAILHIYGRMLFIPLVFIILRKCFKDLITHSMNKAIALCISVIVIDMVIVDAIRYILSGGVSTILFLPVCLPICFMIIMFYSTKDTGRDKKAEKKLTYLIGIPLTLLTLCFEVLSFLQI